MAKVQYGNQVLSAEQIKSYRDHARKALSTSYNLFAEIVLRVIASHEALALELSALRQQRSDREIESEFVVRENDDLRSQLNAFDQERRQLQAQIKQQKQEITRLKRGKIDLPPSWG